MTEVKHVDADHPFCGARLLPDDAEIVHDAPTSTADCFFQSRRNAPLRQRWNKVFLRAAFSFEHTTSYNECQCSVYARPPVARHAPWQLGRPGSRYPPRESIMNQAVHSIQSEHVGRSRSVERLIRGVPTTDGAGVKLTRVLTQDLQRRLDPFLMLDAFGTDNADDYIQGFPDHPHRGFETVTYMIAGQMRHRDSYGNEGLLKDGGVQWMTAGRGVIHSELPEQTQGRMEGFQLWLNLASKDKMIDPWYRDIQSPDIPEFSNTNVTVRIIAGSSHGIPGAIQRVVTQPLYLDIHFDRAGEFTQSIPADANAFIYVYRGQVRVGDTIVAEQTMGLLENNPDSDGLILHAEGPAKVLLIAGKPLNEPIAQHGPFVMNNRQQIIQAFEDFQAGLFGMPKRRT